MDGRIVKGQETKDRILEGALLIISEEGINNLSAKKIADKTGISKSNIFHHFKSIDGVLDVIIGNLCMSSLNQLPIDTCTSLDCLFKMLGDITFTLTGPDLAIYRALFSYYHETLFGDRYKDQILKAKSDIMSFVKESIQKVSGIMISDSLAELITIDVDGLGLHYLIEEDSDKYQKLWAEKSAMYIQIIENQQ